MLPEEKEVVQETETSQDDRFFSDDEDLLNGETQDEVEDDETVSDEEVEESTEEIVEDSEETKPKDKLSSMTEEQLRESYRNLEALVGKQGQELGELRKEVASKKSDTTEEKRTIKDVLSGSDDDLLAEMKKYEDYFGEPNIHITDSDNWNVYDAQYKMMLREFSLRQAKTETVNAKKVEQDNARIQAYSKELGLSIDETDKVVKLASKISDDGTTTQADLEAAMLKLYPGKYRAWNIDKDRQRINEAKAKVTPRVGSGGEPSITGTVSAKSFLAMEPEEQERVLDGMTDDQVEMLKQQINKK